MHKTSDNGLRGILVNRAESAPPKTDLRIDERQKTPGVDALSALEIMMGGRDIFKQAHQQPKLALLVFFCRHGRLGGGRQKPYGQHHHIKMRLRDNVWKA